MRIIFVSISYSFYCGFNFSLLFQSIYHSLFNLLLLFLFSIFCYGHRYKKLLCSVDLTKDFFFSYSYHIMLSLQKNQSNHELGIGLYETMFVWNEFLTRRIRNQLKNTLWIVALVHGFFKQVGIPIIY